MKSLKRIGLGLVGLIFIIIIVIGVAALLEIFPKTFLLIVFGGSVISLAYFLGGLFNSN